jgi:antirestriction protein ArdC
LFHELGHATGHANRLARKSILEPSYFGSHEYSKEELVAEMSASFLSGNVGIENITLENSAAYMRIPADCDRHSDLIATTIPA